MYIIYNIIQYIEPRFPGKARTDITDSSGFSSASRTPRDKPSSTATETLAGTMGTCKK